MEKIVAMFNLKRAWPSHLPLKLYLLAIYMIQPIISTHTCSHKQDRVMFLLYFWPHTSRFAPPSALSSQICVCACLTDCTCVDDPPPPNSHESPRLLKHNTSEKHGYRTQPEGLHKQHNVATAETSPLIPWKGGREGKCDHKNWRQIGHMHVWEEPLWKVKTSSHGDCVRVAQKQIFVRTPPPPLFVPQLALVLLHLTGPENGKDVRMWATRGLLQKPFLKFLAN